MNAKTARETAFKVAVESTRSIFKLIEEEAEKGKFTISITMDHSQLTVLNAFGYMTKITGRYHDKFIVRVTWGSSS
jgi:cellobiose-specific phosphotransferase system component IIA